MTDPDTPDLGTPPDSLAPQPAAKDKAPAAKEKEPVAKEKARIASVVGLSLLEVIRTLDLPAEILAAEDPSRTMPRRLGLSEVVDQQIRIYRQQARRRERITDQRAQDLFHLVLRRPDSEEAFLEAGKLLGEKVRPLRGLRRLYPERLRYSLARKETRRRIKVLFGRPLGGFAHGPFTLEAKAHLLLELDPGGDGCALITGLSSAILGRCLRREVTVLHSQCEARNHELCRWVVSDSD